MPRTLTALLLAGLMFMLPAASFAHTHLERSAPAANAQLTHAPEKVQIWFSSKLEPKFAKVKVTDAQGAQVDKGGAAVNPNDPGLVEISVPPLAPGKYSVTWSVVATDGHRAKGEFSFTVK